MSSSTFPACMIWKDSSQLELIWYLTVILMLFKVAPTSLKLMLAASSDVCAPSLCPVFFPAVFFFFFKPQSPLLFTFCNLAVSICWTSHFFCSSLIFLSSSFLGNTQHQMECLPCLPRPAQKYFMTATSELFPHTPLNSECSGCFCPVKPMDHGSIYRKVCALAVCFSYHYPLSIHPITFCSQSLFISRFVMNHVDSYRKF